MVLWCARNLKMRMVCALYMHNCIYDSFYRVGALRYLNFYVLTVIVMMVCFRHITGDLYLVPLGWNLKN